MSTDSSKVIVPGEGHFYIAPYGTTAPTGSVAPSSPFVEVGHTDRDKPLTIKREGGDVTVLPTWQAPSGVRTRVDPITYSFEFTLLQWDATTLPLYYGGGSVTSGEFRVPKVPTPQTNALFLRVVDGATTWAQYLTKVDIIGSDDIEFDPENLAPLPVTATVLDDSALAYLFAIRGIS